MNTLKIDAATFAADAAWIAKGKSKRSYVPVLATTHVSVTDSGIRLRMTDFDLFREVTVPAEGASAEDVAVLVDPVKLSTFLKGAKGDALVTVDDSGIEIVIGARTVKIARADGDIDDYPSWPEFVPSDSAAAVLEPGQLKSVLTSAGKDATLPMLTGVRFDDDVMATTDRFRLTVVTLPVGGFGDALVPREPLQLFTVGKGTVSVEFGALAADDSACPTRGHVRVSRDNRSVVARELDASFPKFRQLIPGIDSVTVLAELRRTDLLAALAGDNVDLEFQAGGTVTVSGRERHGDVVTSQTIAADIVSTDGLPFTVRVATEYVMAALKAMTGDVIEFRGTTPTRPMVFTAGADLHLIMPQRVPA